MNTEKVDIPNTDKADENIKLSQEISGMINELEVQGVKYNRMFTKDTIRLLKHILSKL